MDSKKYSIEICSGLGAIVLGLALYLWSKQVLWIAIYPAPFTKQIIEALPVVFWSISVLLIVDGVRRTLIQKRELISTKRRHQCAIL